jgi:streptogramin lyase
MRHLIAALALLAAAGVGATGCSGTPESPQAPSPTAASTAPTPPPASRQSVLPFAGLKKPWNVAVDTAGNVYVTDTQEAKEDNGFAGASRVIKLAAGSNTQTTLPQFVHASLVADATGAVWVDDEQLVKLAAGSEPETVLPSPNLGIHGDVLAIDAVGNVYGVNGGGVDRGGGCCVPVHVVKQAPGSDTPTVLPFKYVDGMGGMAVDTAGNVYVGDASTDRVLKLSAAAAEPTVLPFNHIEGLTDLAVDSGGNVYAVDANHRRVLKLTPGSDTPTELPFKGLEHPVSVAVDTAENVYVVDRGNRTVVKLAQA